MDSTAFKRERVDNRAAAKKTSKPDAPQSPSGPSVRCPTSKATEFRQETQNVAGPFAMLRANHPEYRRAAKVYSLVPRPTADARAVRSVEALRAVRVPRKVENRKLAAGSEPR
jgi:hypothetical protein